MPANFTCRRLCCLFVRSICWMACLVVLDPLHVAACRARVDRAFHHLVFNVERKSSFSWRDSGWPMPKACCCIPPAYPFQKSNRPTTNGWTSN